MRYLAILTALLLLPFGVQAKSYSSGSHSYSSGHSSYSSSSHSSSSSFGSSSHSSSFGSSSGHSYSAGSTHSGSSGSTFSPSKSLFSSGTKTYSSGTKTATSHPDSDYSSGTKTYTSHSGNNGSGNNSGNNGTLFTHPTKTSTFDSAAASARQADTSTSTYNSWKNAARTTTVPSSDDTYTRSSYGQNSSGQNSGYSQPRKSYASSGNTYTYIPPINIFSTRQARIHSTYLSYYSRPQTYYRDPYSNFFWWWLLDQSLQNQAYWTYHHRYSMDPSRYQLLMQNQQLAQQVQMLENQQVVRDPSFTPSTLDRDLMYSDQYVQSAANSSGPGIPSTFGKILSRMFAIILFGVLSISVIWLIFFKRWGNSGN